MYSIDFKKQAVKYKENGHTFKELNEAFNISAQTYYDWKKKFEQGYFEKKTKQTRRRKIDKEKLWVNPDCGLKTRAIPETIASLKNMVEAARQIRNQS